MKADNATGQVRAVAFGGARDHDVVCVGIEKDVLKSREANQVTHVVGKAAAFGEAFRDDCFEARQ